MTPLGLTVRVGMTVLRGVSQAIENSNIGNANDASKFTKARRDEYRLIEKHAKAQREKDLVASA